MRLSQTTTVPAVRESMVPGFDLTRCDSDEADECEKSHSNAVGHGVLWEGCATEQEASIGVEPRLGYSEQP